MEQRTISWRSKPNLEIMQMIQIAQELKLYLVQESGPTSFVFKDDEGQKYKVSVGREIKCSCSPSRKDHCVHSLYMMLQKFRIDKSNPIIWQGSYIDSELGDMVSGQFAAKQANNGQRHSFLQARSQNKISSKVSKKPATSQQKYFRLPLDDQTICPICQEDIQSDQPTTFCRRKCGNNFHIHCIKVWIEHKRQSNDSATCPMCRTDMGTRVIQEMNKDMEEFVNRFTTHKGQKCGGCGKLPITGSIYHCLYCENFDLCHLCFDGWQHLQHDKYLTKEKSDSQWVPSIDRQNQFQKNQRDRLGIGGFGGVGAFQPRLSEAQKVQPSYSKIEEFLVTCFPYMKDIQVTNELSIIGTDVNQNKNVCCCCGKSDIGARRLYCGHGIDEKCLKNLLLTESSNLKCPIDGASLLKGYSYIKRKKFGDQTQQDPTNLDGGNEAKNLEELEESKSQQRSDTKNQKQTDINLTNRKERERKQAPFSNNENQFVLNVMKLDNLGSQKQSNSDHSSNAGGQQLKPITGLTKYANIKNSINREIYGNVNKLGADLNLDELLLCQPKSNPLIANNFKQPPIVINNNQKQQIENSRQPTTVEYNFDGLLIGNAVSRISSKDQPAPRTENNERRINNNLNNSYTNINSNINANQLHQERMNNDHSTASSNHFQYQEHERFNEERIINSRIILRNGENNKKVNSNFRIKTIHPQIQLKSEKRALINPENERKLENNFQLMGGAVSLNQRKTVPTTTQNQVARIEQEYNNEGQYDHFNDHYDRCIDLESQNLENEGENF